MEMKKRNKTMKIEHKTHTMIEGEEIKKERTDNE
jgi:hypothetical protein